jgi:hypothetical protein
MALDASVLGRAGIGDSDGFRMKDSNETSAMRAFGAGVRQVLRHPGILILFYLCNLTAALVLIAPAAAALSGVLGHSLEGDRQFENLDPAWIIEALRRVDYSPLQAAPPLIAAVAGVYFLLNIYLAGGAIAVFIKPRDTFFGAGSRYFLRFLRLALWSAPLYAAVLALNAGLAKLISRFADNSMVEAPWVVLGWARALLVLLLLLFVNMIFDYAKVIVVAEGRRSALFAAIDAVRFIGYCFGATTAIFYAGQLIGLLVLAVYHGLAELIPQNSMVLLAVVFLVRQASVLARFFVRLFVWSAEVHYYDAMTAIPEDLLPPADEPDGDGEDGSEPAMPPDGSPLPAG